ncbi:MAG: hypothetical protein RI956_966 [Pseudomonadota bacterium]|jgi:hypothetical protein
MKTFLKKNNATALILSSILLFSTVTQANSTMSELEDSEIQTKTPLFVKSLNFNSDKNEKFLSNTTENSTKTTKSTTEPTQLDYLKQFDNWKSLIKSTTSCSTARVRTQCYSFLLPTSVSKSSTSLIKIEPKQKVVVDIDFHDDSAKNAFAEYEMMLPYNDLEFKTLTGIITATKDKKTSYINNFPYAVYASAIVYTNLGSGITITATAVDKDK